MEIESEQGKYFISKSIDNFFTGITDASKFTIEYFKEAALPPYELNEIARQSYQIGVKSLSLITITGFIIGLVFTQQSRPALASFGASSWLPSLIGVAVIRALAPLMTALICAGKVGSGIGAELGSMRVSQQIDAMEVSGTEPFKYLVVSRVTASMIMTPLLMIYTAFIAIMGSFINVNAIEHTSFTTYILNAFQNISFLDCASSVFRAVVYGLTVGLVSCYYGYTTDEGTVGVGKAANASVVIAMYLVFIEEEIIVQIVNGMR